MKPPRSILFVGEDDDAMAPLRFALRCSRPHCAIGFYIVESASTLSKARATLKRDDYDLVICCYPLAFLDSVLGIANQLDEPVKIMILGETGVNKPLADCYMSNPSMFDFLEEVKRLVHRKRGPQPRNKKGPKMDKQPRPQRKTA